MTHDGIPVDQRDIIFVPYPFSDLSSSKKRPALVISNVSYNINNEDVICCLITSQLKPYKYAVDITNADLEAGHLRYNSKIKPNRLFTLKQSKILFKIGKLNKDKSRKIIENINQIIGIKNPN